MNNTPINTRSKAIPVYGTIFFAVLIALIGAAMMTITSSPQMKGAALLWLPAALQLVAGVWLGPKKGLIAGGIGAYGAGIIAYGGWGLVDIIMNPVAGGLANSWLPAVLFRWVKIDPTFEATTKDIQKGIFSLFFLFIFVISIGLIPIYLGQSANIAYGIAILLLIISAPLLFKGLKIKKKDFIYAMLIAVIVCFISAIFGVWGTYLSGQSLEAAIYATGIGWFLGDTISAFLGIYVLAYFTEKAVEIGLADAYWKN